MSAPLFPQTFPACPNCHAPMDHVVLAANHDRPRLSFFRCRDCGGEREHRVEVLPVEGAPKQVERAA